MSEAHNTVRQILMNELGLTRESVRETMTEIVTDAVARFVNSDQFKRRLDVIITTKIEEGFTGWWGKGADSLARERIVDEIRKAAGKAVAGQLEITVTKKPAR